MLAVEPTYRKEGFQIINTAKRSHANVAVSLYTTLKQRNTDAHFLKKCKPSMKKFALTPFFLVPFAIAVFAWFFINSQPVSSQVSYQNFNITPGESAVQIGEALYKNGLIKNTAAFKIYVQFSALSDRIEAGDYKLSPSFTLFQVVNILVKTPVEVRVTIPEGFTNKQIAARFQKSLYEDNNFKNQFISLSANLQGYLFPDTYNIPQNASPAAIISKMNSNFKAKTAGLPITKEVIVIASIIEGETNNGPEREVVSGILFNRLNTGMPLQVDVAKETYKTLGLPMLPINNPGLSAIQAALNPAKTDYWYYLHDHSGQIHYAKTLEGQNANIKTFLQ